MSTRVYVSNADSRDITVLSLDVDSGRLHPLQTVTFEGQVGPLALSPDRRRLYAAVRTQPYHVASFEVDADDGRLHLIGTAPLPDSMAHLATDRRGQWLFAASYPGNLFSVSPIGPEGQAEAPAQVLPTGRHAHATLVAPSNRHLFVSNLGSDVVMQWAFDADSGALRPNAVPHFEGRAHAGPRHLVFHPNGRFVYLLNELDATVEVLAYDDAQGTLASLQTLPTLPEGFEGRPWAADLHLTPNGRFLYTSERTSSTLACFAVDATSGRLTLQGHVDTELQPRGFNIDPSGCYLIVAGQLSHAVRVCAIDAETGRLTTRHTEPVGQNPTWVEIVRGD
ncbi:6-phosphogluconolactonase [Caldimonas brevitalea]|uniref:6-phosphogluconolactonase n=2 Tax=Caldimonas brevitalea TaxID=413882 RepID=A0A0G3BX20_9BURK|nr:6-phosphogluconolactonase [Caldimonas brevitalea]